MDSIRPRSRSTTPTASASVRATPTAYINRIIAASTASIDCRYPGLRFRVFDEQDRMRQQMRFFVNGEPVFEIQHPLHPTDEVQLVQVLSGG